MNNKSKVPDDNVSQVVLKLNPFFFFRFSFDKICNLTGSTRYIMELRTHQKASNHVYSRNKSFNKQAGAELSQAQPKLGLLFCPSWDCGLAQAGTMVEPKLELWFSSS